MTLKSRFRKSYATALVALVSSFMVSQSSPPAQAAGDDVEARVNKLLLQMTLDEKIRMMSGTKDQMHIPGNERLHLKEIKFSDGPVGVRCWGRSTTYPAGAMLAATWDEQAAYEYGKALGRDSRARGVHVLLAPGVNLYRVAQNGRNFEYLGEDPFLSSRMAVAYVKGCQDENVAVSVKHYAANDQEIQRGSIDTIIDERRLHEICLPPFKAAVQEAGAWTVMAAYNKVNGQWCTANKYLLTDVLRKQWGFKGILMSDWGGVHETLGCLTAGNDLEMGTSEFYVADKIKPLLKEGKITQDVIDEHVGRILRMSVAMGFFDKEQEDKSIPLDDPTSAATALKVAREGVTLLKNKRDFLPLDRSKIRTITVIGPNACPAIIGGGGSSYCEPFSSVSLLDAVTDKAAQVKVNFIPAGMGPDPTSRVAYNFTGIYEPLSSGMRGVNAEYFSSTDLTGKPVLTKNDHGINFMWGDWFPAMEVTTKTYSVRWTGKIKAPQDDNYVFACTSDGARVTLDGKPLFDNWTEGGMKKGLKTIALKRDEVHDIKVEYRHLSGDSIMQFAWSKASPEWTAEEEKQIADADAVIAAVGFNNSSEYEGEDRTYDLPPGQSDLVKAASKLNPRTVVVLNSGGNVNMDKWIDDVSALIHAWYPGQNGNTAVAEAIFGDINPSGRLPDTFEAKWEDSPAFGNYPGDPANGGKVKYAEGIYVGYRWFDKKNVNPRFPFGHGLSYTTFEMNNLNVANAKGADFEASVDVTNTGKREGTEVVQLYVRPVESKIDRPVQELKGFTRVALQPGETRSVKIPLRSDSFATYDEKQHKWVSPDGAYEVAVGSSSRNIHCSQTINWAQRLVKAD